MEIDDWKTTDVNVDSLWIISERDKSGKHSNVYHGNFIPQIPYQLLKRYTTPKDVVVDLFMGSGTTLFECEKLDRKFVGFDINNQIIDFVSSKMEDSTLPYSICNCDVTNTSWFKENMEQALEKIHHEKQIDFFIAHPPYLDIVKFTDKPEDLSQITDVNLFLGKLTQAIGNGYSYLKKNGYFALVIGDVYKKSEVIPLAFYSMYAIKKNFNVKLKGTIIKNIEGNRGKLGTQNIWKYRALKSDYYLFKHEYIFVFKKEK